MLLGDTERLDIDDVRISQFWQLSTPEPPTMWPSFWKGDGAPLAVEHFAGEGRIIVQGLPSGATLEQPPTLPGLCPPRPRVDLVPHRYHS